VLPLWGQRYRVGKGGEIQEEGGDKEKSKQRKDEVHEASTTCPSFFSIVHA